MHPRGNVGPRLLSRSSPRPRMDSARRPRGPVDPLPQPPRTPRLTAGGSPGQLGVTPWLPGGAGIGIARGRIMPTRSPDRRRDGPSVAAAPARRPPMPPAPGTRRRRSPAPAGGRAGRSRRSHGRPAPVGCRCHSRSSWSWPKRCQGPPTARAGNPVPRRVGFAQASGGSRPGGSAAVRGTSSMASLRPHQRQVTDSIASESTSVPSTRWSPARSKCQNSVVRRERVTSNRVRFPQPPQRHREADSAGISVTSPP